MKPKKRQPLDFSAVPVEAPAEDQVSSSEAALAEDETEADVLAPVDPPMGETDLDLEISAPEPSSPRARAASRRGRISEPSQASFEQQHLSATSLATSAAQPPAPVVEPERDTAPARAETRDATANMRRSSEAFDLPDRSERGPMPAFLFWTFAVAAAALWALAPIAFALGYSRDVPALKVEGFALTVFAGLAIGPALLTLLGAYLLRQAQGVSAELRRTRTLTDRLVTPAVLAAAGASGAVEAIRAQIDNATLAADEARERILSLRQSLAEETARLADAAANSARMANQLAQGLGHERQALETLSLTLDTRSTAVVDAIGSQARMVAEASDLAETQLREAEAALAARAADLAAAAAEASDAARVGAEDISRQIARLETAGQGLGDQMSSVEKNLAQQRAALVAASQSLRSEQEDFAAETETRTAQLTEFVSYTRVGATELSDVAAMGAEVLRGLISAASEQFKDMAENAKAERQSLVEETSKVLAAISDAAAGQREGLEIELKQAMEALAASALKASEGVDARVESARGRVDQLNEIAFAAGQKADTVFEARMEEARDLIEQSAQMVEQAGARTAQKLAEAVLTARGTLGELEAMLDEVGQRTADMPAEAMQKAVEVRASIEKGIEELMAAARRTAEETAAIDQAFQDRVRRNYDALSEAAAAMGGPSPARQPQPSMTRSKAAPVAPPQIAPPPPPEMDDDLLADEPGQRPRLRLTPTATDDEFRSVFDTAGGRGGPAAPEGPDGQNWSWRSLLSGIENSSPGDAALGEKLAAEISAMGIDPHALLPRGRIDEIAAAIQTRDSSGAREVVKRLAPAAIRRLVRRLFSDATLRANAERFLKRYAGMIEEAGGQDREGFLVAALLSSDAGRAYLLLDAATGDLA
ncbi:polar localization protein TipN [Caulobacter sp. ErkDOM-YI]|uniref:polar localization protein TipN n=1 Tax=unclassified Caulobacter TaxID=2648921 RepID=UPI003AF66965